MGLDYSYTQPSSSDDYDINSLLLAEAELYANEAESSYTGAIPVDDGDCDNVMTEEMSDLKAQLRQLKQQGNESEQKLVKVEKTLCELSEKRSGSGFALVVCLLVLVLVLIALAVLFLPGRAAED